jgi:hypothetical protein
MASPAPNSGRSPAPGSVFLSYASQDAEAARRICDALHASGIEVWLDQSELKGGDAWDASIRKQISECALFVPIVSEHTQRRLEGYFRLEWRLADTRTHRMAKGTRDSEAHVPDSFLEVQWMRLPGGQAGDALVARVRHLLDPGAAGDSSPRPQWRSFSSPAGSSFGGRRPSGPPAPRRRPLPSCHSRT